MLRVLAALVISYFIICGTAFAVGLWVHDPRSFAVHFGLGLFATIYTCFLHCLVLTYFIITGKLIKQAVAKAGLDARHIEESQWRKSKVLAVSLGAVGLAVIAAVLGVWSNVQTADSAQRARAHLIAEMLAVTCNAVVFYYQYHAIYNNTRHVDAIFERVRSQQTPTSRQST